MRFLSDEELLGESRAPIARPVGAGGSPYDLVLLDRDGTLNVQQPGYVSSPRELILLPGAVAAVRACNAASCAVVLVTNQRGLSGGELTRRQLLSVHRALLAELARCGAWVDGIQVCPHAHDSCDCRKPRAGLVREALRRAPWADPRRCVMVGDRAIDLAAAAAAGVLAARVGHPHRPLVEVVGNLLRTRQFARDTSRTVDATVR